VLAIDSATDVPCVALLLGEEVRAQRIAAPRENAVEFVLPAVISLLEEAGLGLPAVGLLALAIGPGSFTGLRVGLATVKGLSYGSDRPVAAVSTLAALCLAGGSERSPVAALLDARRGEVYAAAYGPGGPEPGEAEIVPEGLYTPEALAARLPQGCRLVGGGARLHAAALAAAGLPAPAEVAGVGVARALGRIGLRRLARGLLQPVADLVPHYLRRAAAEAKRTGEPLERRPAL
jgi:tRNA threonylcarbamoyladenosine biosynthesis protein TsaB